MHALLQLLILILAVFSGCAAPQRQPPGAPPSVESVNRDAPGGDAHDPHLAALNRQLKGAWAGRLDKDGQLVVPLPDARNWKRVRYWLFDHFVGFRYGKDFHALTVVLLRDMPAEEPGPVDRSPSERCVRDAEEWARPMLGGFAVESNNWDFELQKWAGQELFVRTADVKVKFGVKKHSFAAAWAGYAAYPNTCMIFGLAVRKGKQAKLAEAVRKRWIDEGMKYMRPRTKERPVRKE